MNLCAAIYMTPDCQPPIALIPSAYNKFIPQGWSHPHCFVAGRNRKTDQRKVISWVPENHIAHYFVEKQRTQANQSYPEQERRMAVFLTG